MVEAFISELKLAVSAPFVMVVGARLAPALSAAGGGARTDRAQLKPERLVVYWWC